MVKDKKYYDFLEVPHTATADELKKARNELARKYHTDKNPTAGERIKNINCAYDVLSDPETRRIYDLNGEDGVKKCGQGGGMQNGEAATGEGGTGAAEEESWFSLSDPWIIAAIFSGIGLLGLAAYLIYRRNRRNSESNMIENARC